MTRIDFHTNIVDKLSYACRLTRKAYAAGGKLVLLTEDARQAASVNEALWTLSETDFLPHVMLGDALAAQTPIIVTCDNSEQAELPHGDMLINLTRHIPANVGRFQRVFEIISTDEIDAAAGRKRYLDYKQKSYPLTHFVAGKT
ncbi:DNA polymerase III subunit chi [Massilia psychrophila]|uniref:DNA polymerase III subunit chi n=1 Tax=Massilia psychrophila TaxID=1603353 RepID=A0A2G8T037_9BURK|nr:DNA polymerase III subunit chi [Massilia psychrophila]PIL39427.1 DNA polymerase III subunit chi [Massilia psychrophila]GGE76506.1 DNA polymerase III subunit chi [Massilia psychrophila]